MQLQAQNIWRVVFVFIIILGTGYFLLADFGKRFSRGIIPIRIESVPDQGSRLDVKTAFKDQKHIFGASPSEISNIWWIKIEAEDKQERVPLMLTFDEAWRRVELFDSNNNIIAITGADLPISERAVKKREFAIPILIDNGPVLLRLSTDFADYKKPRIFCRAQRHDDFFYESNSIAVANSVYIGFVIGAVFFHLLIWTTLRDILYFLYAVHVLSFSMIWIHKSGVLYEWFLYDFVSWDYYGDFVLSGIAIFCGNLFVEYFLRLKRNLSIISKFLWFVNFSVFVAFLLGVLQVWSLADSIMAFCALLSAFSYFFSGVLCWIRGFKPAGYFLLAHLVMIVAILGYVFHYFGYFSEFGWFLEHAPQASSIFSISMIAFSVSDHIRRLDEHRRQLERQSRSDLEREVSLRTAEIERQRLIAEEMAIEKERMNKKLIEFNKELERLNLHDALTGVANRRFFVKTIEKAWGRWRESKEGFAVLLIDIDHFKSFNDTYGHLAGDECLKTVARRVSSEFAEFFFARYGGEEFVILLLTQDLDYLEKVAESVRQIVSDTVIEVSVFGQLQKTRVTVSIGGCVVGHEDLSFEDLLLRADRALYEAKRRGRNRVVIESSKMKRLGLDN